MQADTIDSADEAKPTVAIVGAGIGGLVLALELHRVGIRCEVFEATAEIQATGVGINLLPHATRVLGRLGLQPELAEIGVTTRESVFYNRFGQFVHAEPSGLYAGYSNPQFSIHRGDLQAILLKHVLERLGADSVHTDHHCDAVEQDPSGATVQFSRNTDGAPLPAVRADVVIACDGVHSRIRKQFYPNEGAPRYSGVTMWRGVSKVRPFLSGASMARIGWFQPGKLVVYPIRNNVDGSGSQLVNWVAELETPQRSQRDWSRTGQLDDFIDVFADWHFDWLDVPALLTSADSVLEYPMADQDPLPRWTFGRVTLLGDAAHPMVPRGSNGAGQAILDATDLASRLAGGIDIEHALAAYESERLPKTSAVVRANRVVPPDSLLREVWERTGDQPFETLSDVISPAEVAAISRRYQEIAGFTKESIEAL